MLGAIGGSVKLYMYPRCMASEPDEFNERLKAEGGGVDLDKRTKIETLTWITLRKGDS